MKLHLFERKACTFHSHSTIFHIILHLYICSCFYSHLYLYLFSFSLKILSK
nr:MAG TPA: hypothetical protein [Caudoviricetes sp.]